MAQLKCVREGITGVHVGDLVPVDDAVDAWDPHFIKLTDDEVTKLRENARHAIEAAQAKAKAAVEAATGSDK
jgi:hypothetical protein